MNFKENLRSFSDLTVKVLKFSQWIVYICVPLLTLFDKLKEIVKILFFIMVKGKQ